MNIIAVIPDTYMGFGHDTLRDIANRKIKKIGIGECVVFVNRQKTACKVLYHGGLIMYYRGKSVLDTEAIMWLGRQAEAPMMKAASKLMSEMRLLFNFNNQGKQKKRA